MTGMWVAGLVAAGVGIIACGVFAGRLLRFNHLERVGREKVTGHLKLRRRMAHLAGRGNNPHTYAHVVRAETMYGWVWILTTRRNGVPLTETIGWSPFQATARRALARRRAHQES